MYSKLSVRILIICGCCVALQACNLNKEADPVIVTDIEDEFQIDFFEKLDDPEKPIVFELQTIGLQDCKNFGIQYEVRLENNRLDISLLDIAPPETCDIGPGAATAVTDPQVLERTSYFTTINLREVISNPGRLVVDEAGYQLTMETDYGFVIPNTTLYKVPNELIWGDLIYEDSLAIVARQFMTEIDQISEPHLLPKGYYGHFQIDTNGKVHLRRQSDHMNTTSFLRKFQGKNQPITTILQQYRKEHPDLQIRIFNSAGETF